MNEADFVPQTIYLREMTPGEIERVREIDRSENITGFYTQHGETLTLEPVDFLDPGWDLDGAGPHSISHQIEEWRPWAEEGIMFGAFITETGRLVGVAILRPRLTETMAQLALLHVTRDCRGRGVGRSLVEEMERRAREEGARALYVSATPSLATVDFYRARGFQPTSNPHPDLLALEPEDIHMVKPLSRDESDPIS